MASSGGRPRTVRRKGVAWPDIEPAHFAKAGTVWHIFPSTVVIPGPTFALC